VSPPKTVSSCTADDIIKFLIYKDKSGKTVVHTPSCSRRLCKCTSRLAAGTVDSLMGKLRAIFNSFGRLGASNPVAHPRVKEYLKFVRTEQANMAITPSQAVPLFFIKFQKLIDYLRKLIGNSQQLSIVNKYMLVRDATFFVIDFFTGDRASDLGRLKTEQVFRLNDREGYLLRFTLAKSVRKGQSRCVTLVPFTKCNVCPVKWIAYIIFLFAVC
jgi:integrase